MFTACNSKPTQVSDFTATLPGDATNTEPNTPSTTTEETTFPIGVTFPDVRNYLTAQGIDLTKVSTNTSKQETLNTIWKTLVNSGGTNSAVKRLAVKSGNSSSLIASVSYFEFDGNGHLIYRNTNDANFSGRQVKQFIKAVVIKINDPGKLADGQYTIGAVYKVTARRFAEQNKGNVELYNNFGLFDAAEGSYEVIYLNPGRSGLTDNSSDTFSEDRANYDTAVWGYDSYYNPTGTYDENTLIAPEDFSSKFSSVYRGLNRQNKQTRFYRQ